MNSEIARLTSESREDHMRKQEDFFSLKEDFLNVERTAEKKKNRILNNMHKQKALLGSLQRALESADPKLYSRLSQNFE